MTRFSKRTDWNTDESDLAQAHRERLAAGLPLADLTASNPTRCGFAYPGDLLDALNDPAAFDYDPDPKGSLRARQAVRDYYADKGVVPDLEHILLTTSTSEAYSYLFKLLCDPGDAMLAMQPSYPLFDYLADAEVVGLSTAGLIYDHGWQLDLEALRCAITPTTRAIVLVHPNNPTGHFTGEKQARELATLCREHDLALIVDEVFLDYGMAGEDLSVTDRASFAGRDLGILIFVVSGISKVCGLPQMKAAWLLAIGPGSAEAMARLEVLADTYLSLNAPVLRALPVWLARRAPMQGQIRERTESNLQALDRQLASSDGNGGLISRLRVEGGWYAILRIPAVQPDEVTARELLDLGVWVHAGYFFGFPNSGWLVVSLLPTVEEFMRGILLLSTYFRWDQGSY